VSDFTVRLKKRNIPDTELLDDLKRCVFEKSKDTITALEYASVGAFGVNTFLRRFKTWNNALELAGLNAPNRQHIPDAELFENIANVWTSLGRQPVGKDMEKSQGRSTVSLGTYEGRFGTWNNALTAFASFIQDGKVSTAEFANKAQTNSTSTKRTPRNVGWRLRAQVLIRDNCICQMCGRSPAKDSTVCLHADHIEPWSKGGETVFENLQTLCEMCNIGKSDMSPLTSLQRSN